MGWLVRGSSAARLAAERADLWLPGTLGALAFFAWLPFVLAVMPWPTAADLAFFGAGFVGAGGLLRAIGLSVGVFVGLVVASGLAAFAEAVLLDWLGAAGRGGPRGSTQSRTVTLFAIQQLCAVPAVAALVLMGLVFASVAPAEFQAPDLSRGLLSRILAAMAPFVLLFTAALLLGQLIGGAATRHVAERGLAVGHALLEGVRDLVRRPTLVVVALVTLATHVGYLAFSYLLLRVLWAPLAPPFSTGQLAHPATPLLLVGFMAIWFCLVLGAGAVHAWASVWWTAEVAAAGAEAGREEAAPSAHRT
jgi:hypothetical protein